MKGSQRLLAVAISSTLAAGVVGVFVKDTEPDMPISLPTTTTTPTVSPSPTPTTQFSPNAPESPEASPSVTPSPKASPRATRKPEPDPLPETGLPSQSILGLFAIAGAAVLAMERRRAR